MANGKLLSIDIPKFEGDPDILPFFLEQIKSVSSINKYSDQATVTLLKSKLAGPALKFITQKPSLFQSNDFAEIEKQLSEFFAPPSKTQAIVEFNNIKLLPAETCKSFENFVYHFNCETCSLKLLIRFRTVFMIDDFY